MKETFFKYLPFAVGGALGWLLFRPPAVFDSLGPARYVVTGALVALLLILFVAFQILANFPTNVELTAVSDGEVTKEMRTIEERLVGLGFARAGPPLRVGVAPPALLVPFVSESDRTYATAFRTGTVPAKTSFELVSIVEGNRGGLNSSVEPMGAMVPAGPGSLRQCFPLASVDAVVERHRESIEFLSRRGIRMKPVFAGTLQQDLRESLARQRAAFLSSPIRQTITTLWRATTRSTPHIGKIANQQVAQPEIRKLRRN